MAGNEEDDLQDDVNAEIVLLANLHVFLTSQMLEAAGQRGTSEPHTTDNPQEIGDENSPVISSRFGGHQSFSYLKSIIKSGIPYKAKQCTQ